MPAARSDFIEEDVEVGVFLGWSRSIMHGP